MNDEFVSPIGTRYSAPEISKIWSQNNKIYTMRKLWVTLAKTQKKLGLDYITDEAINEMEENVQNIDYNKIQEYEKIFKHDIVAHLHAFADICPKAKSIIHLGVTSNYINDNTDSILIRDSLKIIKDLTNNLIDTLRILSFEYRHTPTLGYTHLQEAQLITVGKRFTIWNSDIMLDQKGLINLYYQLPFRGVKGTVGSEDSILKLFNGDHNKCKVLNQELSYEHRFVNIVEICGQTYSRKYDTYLFSRLSQLCQSIYKMANDVRLLSSKNEINEFFSCTQVGSSAMPYKKNPITCEKICSLCRYVVNQEQTMNQTYMNQWLERSLDDSAVRRIILPECLMLVEHILKETNKMLLTIQVNKEHITNIVEQRMPYIVSEEVIIKGVEMGYDRQDLHERIRKLLVNNNKNTTENIFLTDPILETIFKKQYISMCPSHYIGRCVQQIEEFYK